MATPTVFAALDSNGVGVVSHGNYLYALDTAQNIYKINITNSSDLTIVSTEATTTFLSTINNISYASVCIDSAGVYLYILGVDTQSGNSLVRVLLATGEIDNSFTQAIYGHGIFVVGTKLYISNKSARNISVINLSTTPYTSTTIITDLTTPAGLTYFNNKLYVLCSNSIQEIDINNLTPTATRLVEFNFGGDPCTLTNDGVYFYAIDRNIGNGVITRVSVNGVVQNDNGTNTFISFGGYVRCIYYASTTNSLYVPVDGSADINAVNLQAPCFKEGTQILTNKGYKSIETLRKGDLIQTLKNGYKKIDTIGKTEINHLRFDERVKNQLYKCSKTKYPELFDDLIITGSHSILVNSFKNDDEKEKTIETIGKIYVTDNKYRLPACVDNKTTVYETPGIYTIYHIALENDNYYANYGIYANGLLVETCSKRYLKELSNMTFIEN